MAMNAGIKILIQGLKNRLLATAFACLLPFFCLAQTTNISGIVNSYYSVIEVLPTAYGAVRVDDVTGLSYGNMVVIAQMKGATIQTGTGVTFGDTMSLNNAGNYEIATICNINVDTVFFFQQLANTYTFTEKVQLVRFGEYYNANVTAALKPQSWNSTTGKGGILAIRCEETLTLSAPIFADSTGYKGGSFFQHSGTCGLFTPVGNLYAYDATSGGAGNGAYKGEGVADVPSNLDGARGAPANGGGGGNNHNNGGGGGANLSSGGLGGGNFSSGPTGCTGNLAGSGGRALSPWGNKKIFMGGGGGAGHANNTVQPYSGGNGGGIVIIIARNIIGNSQKISANGGGGRNTAYDGAGGGGAGGTIIMHVINSYTGPLTIEANGGVGGNEDDDNISSRCYGAGGGGSGGRIYFNGIAPAVTFTTNGGAGGINIDSHSGCLAGGAPSSPGSAGIAIAGYNYKAGAVPSSYCEFILPIKLEQFVAYLIPDRKVKFEWTISNPEEAKSFAIERMGGNGIWTTVGTVNANDLTRNYTFIDNNPLIGESIYRLRMNGKDNSISYSPIKRIFIKPNDLFTIFPNPTRNRLVISGQFETETSITLTDVSGKFILDKKLPAGAASHEILLPSLPAGVYLLRSGSNVEKLMIQ